MKKGKSCRYRPGVPFSLGRIIMTDFNRCAPRIKPFPNWEINLDSNCRGIKNAVDVFLDHWNMLWVLDAGIVNSLEKPVKVSSPRVFGICPDSGKVI
jgi:hypothetical protein